MIKMTVQYEDFDGKEVSEDLYFHLSKSELIDMAVGEDDIVQRLQDIANSGDAKKIIAAFKDIIGKSYGIRQGPTRFTKSDDLTDEFFNSPAFDALLDQLLTDANVAAKFVTGVVPKDLSGKIDPGTGEVRVLDNVEIKEIVLAPFTDEQSGLNMPRDSTGELLPWAFRLATGKEQREMSREQLLDLMHRQSVGWRPPEPVTPV